MAAVVVASLGFALWATDRGTAFDPGESSLVPIAPCRLFDTRPGDQNVGFREGPLPADTEIDVQVTGANGRCAIPAGATAVAVNFTALDASQPTFVSVWPDGTDNPGTSALNVYPNQPPTPNKIDVQLSPAGQITIYNRFGQVELLADVMGYYSNGNLTELDARVSALEAAESGPIDADTLQGTPAADLRAWPLSFTSATGGAVVAATGGPMLPNSGSPTLVAHYSVPPGYTPGNPVEVSVVVHKFSGDGCTARIRVWGIGAPATDQTHSVTFPTSPSSSHVVLTLEFANLGDASGAYLNVGRDADDPADTCTLSVNVRGAHISY
jgi:hypothetical protein